MEIVSLLTNYFDRQIDSQMTAQKERPQTDLNKV